MNSSYWINSNTGDYVVLDDKGIYHLNLISRFVDNNDCNHLYTDNGYKYLESMIMQITYGQFLSLKGFVPIKRKKLFGRKIKIYAPTLSDGTKGKSERYNVHGLPGKREAREIVLKSLGL